MALTSAVLRQACDLVSLMPQLASGFSFASASGVQLDALGASAGIPRQEGWEDETYRAVLLRKLRIWSWDGTNETAGEFLLPGETLRDNGNNSVAVSADLLPLPAEEPPGKLMPSPELISSIFSSTGLPMFPQEIREKERQMIRTQTVSRFRKFILLTSAVD